MNIYKLIVGLVVCISTGLGQCAETALPYPVVSIGPAGADRPSLSITPGSNAIFSPTQLKMYVHAKGAKSLQVYAASDYSLVKEVPFSPVTDGAEQVQSIFSHYGAFLWTRHAGSDSTGHITLLHTGSDRIWASWKLPAAASAFAINAGSTKLAVALPNLNKVLFYDISRPYSFEENGVSEIGQVAWKQLKSPQRCGGCAPAIEFLGATDVLAVAQPKRGEGLMLIDSSTLRITKTSLKAATLATELRSYKGTLFFNDTEEPTISKVAEAALTSEPSKVAVKSQTLPAKAGALTLFNDVVYIALKGSAQIAQVTTELTNLETFPAPAELTGLSVARDQLVASGQLSKGPPRGQLLIYGLASGWSAKRRDL